MNSSMRRLLLTAACLSGTCNANAQIVSPKVIAHRGASKEAPENTLSAFERAVSIGVDALEMDIHLTSDGVPIVVHDGFFGRTTDGAFMKRTIDLTLEEVKSLDAGAWFCDSFKEERIPAFEEVVKLAESDVRLMVEIKNDNSQPKDIVDAVFASLKDVKKSVLIGSFDPLIIEEARKKNSTYEIMGIIEEPHMVNTFRKMSVTHMAIWYPLLSAELIQQLHEENIEVWTFTVDNPWLAKYLAALGVDGIITNDPRKIKQAFVDHSRISSTAHTVIRDISPVASLQLN